VTWRLWIDELPQDAECAMLDVESPFGFDIAHSAFRIIV
jgi:hypothetical protein